MRFFIVAMFVHFNISAWSQPNCAVFEGPCREACEVFNRTANINQGTFQAHKGYDSAIALCPRFAYAHHERSVAWLKNGEFVLWKTYMDEAVRIDPRMFQANRGWCRFKFLRDYPGALEDLIEARRNRGFLGWSGDGDYDLELMVALCYRELKQTDTALALMRSYFHRKETDKNSLGVGIYDYLHYGVTLFRAGENTGAIDAFEKQVGVYKQLPDTYYYLAMIYKQQGNTEKYRENLNLADEYFVKGFERKDPYCEALDEVYHSNVRTEMANHQE